MWLYIPNVGKPIRITSLQSVIGGNRTRYFKTSYEFIKNDRRVLA